jgi:signal transduction histidine kinase
MAQTQVDQAVDCGRDADYTGPDRLPVLTNAVALRRALANLIDNALTYGGSARVTLGVGKAGIELAVEDSGPGIAEDMLPRVLQPFVRLDAARERNSRGMGLGLTIVERSIRALGGTLILANRREGACARRSCCPLRLWRGNNGHRAPLFTLAVSGGVRNTLLQSSKSCANSAP